MWAPCPVADNQHNMSPVVTFAVLFFCHILICFVIFFGLFGHLLVYFVFPFCGFLVLLLLFMCVCMCFSFLVCLCFWFFSEKERKGMELRGMGPSLGYGQHKISFNTKEKWLSLPQYPCVCTCVHVYELCVGVHTYLCTCMCRQEINVGCHSSSVGFSLGPGAHT